MKRIVCLLIAALSVSLLLGGCGQNSDPLAIQEFIIGDSIGTVEQRGSGKDAEYVILDEATAFADPENEALIQKAFTTLTKGRTVIMIAHRLSTVVGADKILVLEGGRVVEQGSHRELVETGGLYARMWADYNQSVQWKITSEEEAK